MLKPHIVCILLSIVLPQIAAQTIPYNHSLCADIEIDSLHYYINSQQDNKDLSYT